MNWLILFDSSLYTFAYFLIDHFCQEKLDTKTLMEKFAGRISVRQIEELRIVKRAEIMDVLKKQMEAT